jgi:hypothetical protein
VTWFHQIHLHHITRFFSHKVFGFHLFPPVYMICFPALYSGVYSFLIKACCPWHAQPVLTDRWIGSYSCNLSCRLTFSASANSVIHHFGFHTIISSPPRNTQPALSCRFWCAVVIHMRLCLELVITSHSFPMSTLLHLCTSCFSTIGYHYPLCQSGLVWSWVGGHYSQGTVSVAVGPSPLLLAIERLVMLFFMII